MTGRREDEEGGGGIRIAGGRFVEPAAGQVLPPVRSYTLQNAIRMEPGADAPFHIGGISAVTIGECYINTIEFLYPWNTTTRVTSVPAGEQFDFVVNYKATNSVGGVLDAWSMCIVWWDDEWDIAGAYFNSGYSTTIQNQISRIAGDGSNSKIIADGAGGTSYPFKMPNHNVILHFNMFINDDHAPSTKWPPTSIWTQLR